MCAVAWGRPMSSSDREKADENEGWMSIILLSITCQYRRIGRKFIFIVYTRIRAVNKFYMSRNFTGVARVAAKHKLSKDETWYCCCYITKAEESS